MIIIKGNIWTCYVCIHFTIIVTIWQQFSNKKYKVVPRRRSIKWIAFVSTVDSDYVHKQFALSGEKWQRRRRRRQRGRFNWNYIWIRSKRGWRKVLAFGSNAMDANELDGNG